MCTGRVTSCSNKVRRPVAATNRFVCTGEFLWKSLSPRQNFVAATSRKKSNQTESVRLVAAPKFCCSDKDFHKFLQCTRSDLSLQRVAATCCCNLSPSVYRPLVFLPKLLHCNTPYVLYYRKYARSDWLRGAFAWEYVNMVVASSCLAFRALITQARIWKSFQVQNSTSSLYLPIPSSAETWKIVTKKVCQFFFA